MKIAIDHGSGDRTVMSIQAARKGITARAQALQGEIRNLGRDISLAACIKVARTGGGICLEDYPKVEGGGIVKKDWATYPLEVIAREHVLNDEEIREMCAEIARLTDILNTIEILTATGEGLTPEECINIHLMANARAE